MVFRLFSLCINITWKVFCMYEKKHNNFKSPDLSKLQEVIIDLRTRIYIAVGADPEEARNRYLSRFGNRKFWTLSFCNSLYLIKQDIYVCNPMELLYYLLPDKRFMLLQQVLSAYLFKNRMHGQLLSVTEISSSFPAQLKSEETPVCR